MKHVYTYSITKDHGDSLDVERYLKQRGYSRHLIVQLRKWSGSIMLNGTPVYTTRILSASDQLVITLPPETSNDRITPTPMELSIVYEDSELLIINKATGVPIHPSQGNYEHTLANALAAYLDARQEQAVFRAVNRLDRDTTGLLILAGNALSSCILGDMVRNRQIHRTYLAVVSGNAYQLQSDTPHGLTIHENAGTIQAPIARVCESTIERTVDFEHGEPAITHFEVLSYDATRDCSLLRLRLETGRTHQIRVHMKYIGHPLPGDFLYNPDYRYCKRQQLHSYQLDFLHPITNEPLSFTAPIPEDFMIRAF